MTAATTEDAQKLYRDLLASVSLTRAANVLNKAIEGVGFSAFSFIAPDRLTTEGQPLHLTSLLPDFAARYLRGQVWARDPTLHLARYRQSPYLWGNAFDASETGLLPGTSWRDLDALASEHGYRDGLVLPIHAEGKRQCLSLLSAERILPAQLSTEIIALALAGGLGLERRLAPDFSSQDADTNPSSELTIREKDVLRWLSEGKTSEEIGKILAVSPKTVNFHVGNLMHKLDAMNRTHAVARAIRLQII